MDCNSLRIMVVATVNKENGLIREWKKNKYIAVLIE